MFCKIKRSKCRLAFCFYKRTSDPFFYCCGMHTDVDFMFLFGSFQKHWYQAPSPAGDVNSNPTEKAIVRYFSGFTDLVPREWRDRFLFFPPLFPLISSFARTRGIFSTTVPHDSSDYAVLTMKDPVIVESLIIEYHLPFSPSSFPSHFLSLSERGKTCTQTWYLISRHLIRRVLLLRQLRIKVLLNYHNYFCRPQKLTPNQYSRAAISCAFFRAHPTLFPPCISPFVSLVPNCMAGRP